MFLEEKREGELQVLEPSVKNLAYALRHEEMWPKDFHWNYGMADCCAMGLAHRLWMHKISTPTSSTVAEALGIDHATAYKIFVCGNRSWLSLGLGSTNPKQIAKTLERL